MLSGLMTVAVDTIKSTAQAAGRGHRKFVYMANPRTHLWLAVRFSTNPGCVPRSNNSERTQLEADRRCESL